MKDKGCVDIVLSIQYKQLFCILYKAVVVGDRVANRLCTDTVILNDRRIYERLGEVTAVF